VSLFPETQNLSSPPLSRAPVSGLQTLFLSTVHCPLTTVLCTLRTALAKPGYVMSVPSACLVSSRLRAERRLCVPMVVGQAVG